MDRCRRFGMETIKLGSLGSAVIVRCTHLQAVKSQRFELSNSIFDEYRYWEISDFLLTNHTVPSPKLIKKINGFGDFLYVPTRRRCQIENFENHLYSPLKLFDCGPIVMSDFVFTKIDNTIRFF